MPGARLQDLWTGHSLSSTRKAVERAGLCQRRSRKRSCNGLLRRPPNEGDLVLDCFVGSGTTAVVAEKLGIAAGLRVTWDVSPFTPRRKRLLSVPRVKPFAVQNLGKYERQAWQTAEFQTGGESAIEQQRLREAAYRKFILDLYHATPITGTRGCTGLKSGRLVHVGAVDAPVTLSDVKAIAREVWKAASSGGASTKSCG